MNSETNSVNNVIVGFRTKTKRKVFLGVKRAFDIICSMIGCFFLIPIAVIIKIAYLLSGDTKSIFYHQKRIGKKGKLIHIYKFRSMVYNADELLKELLKDEKYKNEWNKKQKFENDPRITKVGKILRKTSLDEMPQFINVFFGEMSMIGPRPLVKGELDAHNGNHEIYESIKPGMTGWWACNRMSIATYEERLDLEYYYIKNFSLWLDVKCLFKTIDVVLLRKEYYKKTHNFEKKSEEENADEKITVYPFSEEEGAVTCVEKRRKNCQKSRNQLTTQDLELDARLEELLERTLIAETQETSDKKGIVLTKTLGSGR